MLRLGASQDLTQGWAHPSLLPAFGSVPQPGHPHCQGHHRLRRSAEPRGEAAVPSNRHLPSGQPPAQLGWTSTRSDSTCPLCPCPWGKLQPFRGVPRGHPVNSQIGKQQNRQCHQLFSRFLNSGNKAASGFRAAPCATPPLLPF